jgi:hypothetical protein
MSRIAPADPILRRIALPSIIRISDAFKGQPLLEYSLKRLKSSRPHYLYRPVQLHLMFEM